MGFGEMSFGSALNSGVEIETVTVLSDVLEADGWLLERSAEGQCDNRDASNEGLSGAAALLAQALNQVQHSPIRITWERVWMHMPSCPFLHQKKVRMRGCGSAPTTKTKTSRYSSPSPLPGTEMLGACFSSRDRSNCLLLPLFSTFYAQRSTD